VPPKAQERLVQLIRSELASGAPGPAQPQPGAIALCGLGGTAVQLAWLLQGWRGENKHDAHMSHLAASDLADGLAVIGGLSLDAVRQLRYLDPARAEIIYAGAVIILELLAHYAATEFTTVDRGLRWGLLLGDA
jgi:exopolyphosphatase / guanosine-5'-triphosphate,3'-diphosphate pyrophosphatase